MIDLEKDLREIVGIQIGDVIYRDLDVVYTLSELTPLDVKPISRAEFKFMAAFDLNPEFDKWAALPTLMYKNCDGNYEWPHRVLIT